MGLGTICKEETLRMKNVSIVSSGGRKLCLWVEENCTHRIIPIYIYVGIYIKSQMETRSDLSYF
jgi:hypothetical protein